MQQLLHILMVAVILACPYGCCPAAAKADDAPCCTRCCHRTNDSPAQAPAEPSCQGGDCVCRGAVLSSPVEMQLDLSLPTLLSDASHLLASARFALASPGLDSYSAHAGPLAAGFWTTGRELRLAIDSLLI